MAVTDPVFSKHAKDFAQLRRGRSGRLRVLIWIALPIALAIGAIKFVSSYGAEGDTIRAATIEALSLRATWTEDLVNKYYQYQNWLSNHGTKAEAELFDNLARALLRTAIANESANPTMDEENLLHRFSVALYFTVLRVGFLLITCVRFWALAVLVALSLNIYASQPYGEKDILGQTGNGRLYFSGSLVKLDSLSESGATDIQIRGLACPKYVPLHITRSSDLGSLLSKYGALNDTNVHLASIILSHPQVPAYVPRVEEQKLLDEFYSGAGLVENCYLMLEKVLSLHAMYQTDPEAELPAPFQPALKQNGKYDKFAYSHLVLAALDRVLTQGMRRDMANIPAAEVACAVLAYEAGKVLTFAKEAGKWIKRSAFPQLNARAILHSVPSFSEDFTSSQRQVIRRALVYASRHSEFGTVRFPLDFSERSAALRQWIEVLMAAPHELVAATDEAELYGLVRETEGRWRQKFYDAVLNLKSEAQEDLFAGPSNALYMPLKQILKICSEIIDPPKLRRLEELCFVVSQRQKLHTLSLEFQSEADRTPIPSHQKIFAPLGFGELKELAELHKLKIEEVKDWSALRVVFNSFGWLGRRVGDKTVPDCSLISCVFKESNSLNGRHFIGRHAMVALRGTHIEQKWGKNWGARFARVDSAQLALNKEEFDKAMLGIVEKPPMDDLEELPATA